MLVTRGDEVLLGRQPTWPPGRYSALAGFVEPGESLEEAVAREVREEAGVDDRARRATSPRSRGRSRRRSCSASSPSTPAASRAIGDAELEDVRWFTRDEVARGRAGRGRIGLPPPLAIARTLIDTWLRGQTLHPRN